MKNTNEKKMIEIEHYCKIFEYFEEEEDKTNREIFRDKYLASLMGKLKQNPDTYDMVKNSIVIMNVLIDDNKPADMFGKIGQSKEELSKKDAKILRKKLKKLISAY